MMRCIHHLELLGNGHARETKAKQVWSRCQPVRVQLLSKLDTPLMRWTPPADHLERELGVHICVTLG